MTSCLCSKVPVSLVNCLLSHSEHNHLEESRLLPKKESASSCVLPTSFSKPQPSPSVISYGCNTSQATDCLQGLGFLFRFYVYWSRGNACYDMRGQLPGVGSLFPPCWPWGSNSAWQQVSLPSEPSGLPLPLGAGHWHYTMNKTDKALAL